MHPQDKNILGLVGVGVVACDGCDVVWGSMLPLSFGGHRAFGRVGYRCGPGLGVVLGVCPLGSGLRPLPPRAAAGAWGARPRRPGGQAVRSFRQEVWNFASGGDLLGSLDSIHVPHPRVDLREQVRRIQPAEALFRHQEHLPDHGGGPV
jgi:hypothetical protein